MNEINNNLQRVRELTVQAANGSNSPEDLQSIQNEIDQRLEEIDRVAEQTNFNGVQVLGGRDAIELTMDPMIIQVGAHNGQTIEISLQAINANTLGLASFSVVSEEISFAAADEVTEADLGVQGTGTLNLAGGATGTLDAVYGDVDGDMYAVVADNGTTTVHKVTGTEVDGDGTNDNVNVTIGAAIEGAVVDGTGITIPGGTFPHAAEGEVGLLKTLDNALQRVDDLRSHLGAVQNRFESTIANLNNTVNNLSAARSRIEDADYAVEVSNMTRAQILQQAGTSVLAQANQVPQTVLSLLR